MYWIIMIGSLLLFCDKYTMHCYLLMLCSKECANGGKVPGSFVTGVGSKTAWSSWGRTKMFAAASDCWFGALQLGRLHIPQSELLCLVLCNTCIYTCMWIFVCVCIHADGWEVVLLCLYFVYCIQEHSKYVDFLIAIIKEGWFTSPPDQPDPIWRTESWNAKRLVLSPNPPRVSAPPKVLGDWQPDKWRSYRHTLHADDRRVPQMACVSGRAAMGPVVATRPWPQVSPRRAHF